ncbi:MAG: ABC transporter ATP-binding protein [Dehalococcoidia bacterium]|jgi:ABC-2 type transport system ATP-binding protein
MNEAAITASHLDFDYGKLRVIDDMSLEIPAGVSFGLLGPNGAGKTTLIRLLVGLLKPKSGSIRVLGKDLTRRTAQLIGYMPQLPALYSELTVQQNVNFFARVYRMKDKSQRDKRVEEVIKLVDLWERRKDSVIRLSGGMKQRVSLACAIVHKPPLLFLDEPTVGLDPELRYTFWEHFAKLTKQGTTLIVSSHTMDDANHCDRLALMRNGAVIAQGTPAELKEATGKKEANLEDAFLYFVNREEKNV